MDHFSPQESLPAHIIIVCLHCARSRLSFPRAVVVVVNGIVSNGNKSRAAPLHTHQWSIQVCGANLPLERVWSLMRWMLESRFEVVCSTTFDFDNSYDLHSKLSKLLKMCNVSACTEVELSTAIRTCSTKIITIKKNVFTVASSPSEIVPIKPFTGATITPDAGTSNAPPHVVEASVLIKRWLITHSNHFTPQVSR